MAANPFGAHQAGIGIAGRNKGAIFWLHPYDRARHQWLWIADAIWWCASLRYETVFCSHTIDQPSKFGGIRDEAEQALPTQAAHQARHETCPGCVLPLSIGFAADAERWIARIIYEERMPACRV